MLAETGVYQAAVEYTTLLANAELVAAPAGGQEDPREPSHTSYSLPQSALWLRINCMPAP